MLEEAIQIPLGDYLNLKNPIFKGQTSVDENNKYWMIWEDEGILYKTQNTLFNL
jgi:hypothetical protein